MAEQSVRVTARGDFTQLQRGLRQLQDDLRNVTGEINRGARKGGFFDESQIRALDFFGKRFKTTLQEMKDALQENGHAFERLLSMSRRASGAEQEAIEKEIANREKAIQMLEEQIEAAEKLYDLRQREAAEFNKAPSGDAGTSPSGRRPSPSERDLGGGLLSTAMGGGRLLLGLAGIGGIFSMITEAYRLAYSREVDTLDLAQRMRGSGGRFGSSTDMFDTASEVGRRDRMGYTGQETWEFLDMYTRQAGGIDADEQYRLMKFGRAYGLHTSEVAGLVGQSVQSGGGLGSVLADAVAGSVERSGMTTRIVEVMEANNALLQTMNTTLRDGSAQTLLAYQTTLDTIGMERGMTQLTGASGANIISGLGGIFSPTNDNWKWMGIRALQTYDPEKYGNMNLFGLEQAYEDGLMNTDNIMAMSEYVKGQSGGNNELSMRILQKWLMDGGYVASKREASELWDATGGLSTFSPEQLRKLQGGAIDSGAKYDAEREGAQGQAYLDTDARFVQALTQAGEPLVSIVQGLKESSTQLMEGILDAVGDTSDYSKKIYEFITNNWKTLATVAGVTIVANNVLKIIGALGALRGLSGMGMAGWLGRFGVPAALVAAGTYGIVKGEEGFSQFIKDGGFQSGDVAKENFKAMHGTEAPEWVTKPSQLDMNSPDYFRSDPRWAETPEGRQGSEWLRLTPEERKERVMETPAGRGLTDEQVGGMQDYLRGLKDSYIVDPVVGGDSTPKPQNGQSTTKSPDELPWYDPLKIGSSIGDFLQNLVTGDLFRGGSGIGNFNDIGQSGVTSDQLNKKLGGALSGYGGAFTEAGQRYGIDPSFLGAVAMHETGNGTSNAIKTKNNVGGMMGKDGLMSFGSIEEGIDRMASNLKRNYIDQGLTTIDQIQRKYAPIGAGNDPTGLNNHWQGGVRKFMDILNDEQLSQTVPKSGNNQDVRLMRSISEVNVNLTGAGADKLTQMSKEQLIALIKNVWTEQEREKRLTNPTKGALT